MTIILSPELERVICEKVSAGLYPSAEAMVNAAIECLLKDEDDFKPGEPDQLLKVGADELDRDEVFDAADVFAEMRRKSAKLRAEQKA